MADNLDFNEIRDLYLDCLREEGYIPKIDEDGDIYFKKEGHKFTVAMSEKDLTYLSLSSVSIYDDALRDRFHALEVINDVQFKYKAVKMLLFDGDDMYISFKIENFLDAPVAFKNVLIRSIDLLMYIMNNFEKSIAKFDEVQQSSST